MNLSNISSLNIKIGDYRCIIDELAKVKQSIYSKMWIWLKKVEHYKMQFFKIGKENITFGDIEVEKHKLHCYKSSIF